MPQYRYYCGDCHIKYSSNSPVGPVACGINRRHAHWANFESSTGLGIKYEYNNPDGSFYCRYMDTSAIRDRGETRLYYPPVPNDHVGKRPFKVISAVEGEVGEVKVAYNDNKDMSRAKL